jgi:hypothetical protein
MLCSLCESIFLGCADDIPCDSFTSALQDENRRVHHNLSTLKLSASSGCGICSRLWAQVTSITYKDAWSEAQSLIQTHAHNACTVGFQVQNGQIQAVHRIWGTDGDGHRAWHENHSCLLGFLSFYQPGVPIIEDSSVDWAKVHQGTPIVAKTIALSLSWNQILAWLRQCETRHSRCRGTLTEERRLPTRLLDVGTPTNPGMLRLCTTRTLPHNTRYMTLSYRWGGEQATRLLSHNLNAFMERIDEARLPPTFREAIFITRRFGIRYLWIDSLCIKQDADDLSDWQIEASKMHTVYGHSHLNLAACASNSAYGGLLRQRNAALLRPCVITLVTADHEEQEYVCNDKEFFKVDFRHSPLHHRGWVMQETLLAPRTLYFASSQLFWGCHELFACERWTQGIISAEKWPGVHRSLLPADDRKAFLDREWRLVRAEYMEADLTFSRDRLPAFSGIAQQFLQRYKASGHPQRYLAGMWESELTPALLWEVQRDSMGPLARLEIYQAPSWSWASINGKTVLPDIVGPDLQGYHIVQIVEICVVPAVDNDSTGLLRTAYLCMEVPVLWAYIKPITRRGNENAIATYVFSSESFSDGLWVYPDQGWPDWDFGKQVLLANLIVRGSHVTSDPSIKVEGLLLLPVAQSLPSDTDFSFVRVGAWSLTLPNLQSLHEDSAVREMWMNRIIVKIL